MDEAQTFVTPISVGVTTRKTSPPLLLVPKLETNAQDAASGDTIRKTVSNPIVSVARGSARCPVRTLITITVNVQPTMQRYEGERGSSPLAGE